MSSRASTRPTVDAPQTPSGWQPTLSHVRSATVAVVLIAVAIVFRRPDLLVLATPFAIITAWAASTRPTSMPEHRSDLGHTTIREGDGTTWRAKISGASGADVMSVVLRNAEWLERRPSSGAVTVAVDVDATAVASIDVRQTRWGRHGVGPAHLMVASTWGAFYWSTNTEHQPLIALPLPVQFDPEASSRPTDGLVGLYRATRQGEGSEFAGVRPFQVGDRMRRINWARSLRSEGLHVNATWAEQDTHVALVIDASADVGPSEGTDGRASSLDSTVRAAGAIAEHYARRGDRVSLQVLGSTRHLANPPATGQSQLVRILDTLTRIEPPTSLTMWTRGSRYPPLATRGNQMTVMLSPLVSSEALDRAVDLSRHGIPVAIIDTLPADVTSADDDLTALAWRIRLLERRREFRLVQQVGIPVIAWVGPQSLDQFLHEVTRRASAPRMGIQ